MNDFWEFLQTALGGFLIGVVFGFFTTFWIGMEVERGEWERATIERGLSQYCPLDGNWAWKGECND